MNKSKGFRRILGSILIGFGLFQLFYLVGNNLADLRQIANEVSAISIGVFTVFVGAILRSNANKQE